MKKLSSSVGKMVDERYGFDMRNKFALCMSLISVLMTSTVSGRIWVVMFYTVSITSLIYVFWLMLSKEVSRRTEEREHLEYLCYKIKRRVYIAKRCLMVWRRHGYFVNIKCGQHVCLLCREKKVDTVFMYAPASPE